MQHSANRVLLSLFLFAAGVSILLIGTGLLVVDPGRVHAPAWLITLLGLPFIAGGVAVLARPDSSLGAWAGGTVTVVITVASAWVALYGPSQQFISGGLPFLSRETDVLLARAVFGCVTLLGLAMIVAAARRTWGPSADR